jgi:hypothetical protein
VTSLGIAMRLEGEEAGRVRFTWPIPDTDPIALARLAVGGVLPGRIVVRARMAAIEGTCAAGEVDRILERLACGWAPETSTRLPVVDFAPGVLGVHEPSVELPVFLRLATPETAVVDRARATYLLVANAGLGAAVGGWIDGAGMAVERLPIATALHEVGRALRALGEEAIARSYLEVCGISGPGVPSAAD